MIKTIITIILLISSIITVSSKEITGKTRVIDGDTIKINNKSIRLHGIDAPENSQLCHKNNKTTTCGKLSTNKLRSLVGDKSVRCDSNKKGKYKRFIAICYVGNVNINHYMVLNGLAFAKYSNDYKEAEQIAKKNKRNIWDMDFIYPWDYRKQFKKNRLSCKMIKTCADAYYNLKNKNMFWLDGNKNGIPCEKLCK